MTEPNQDLVLRLDRLEAKLERLTALMEKVVEQQTQSGAAAAPDALEAAAWAGLIEPGGVSLGLAPKETFVGDALQEAETALSAVYGQPEMTERLSEAIVQVAEPETLDALVRLAALAPQLEYAAHAVAAGPELLEEALEAIRDGMARAEQDPNDLKRRLQAASRTLLTLTEAPNLALFQQLAQMGPRFAPVATATADAFGQLAAVEGSGQLSERLSEAIVQVAEPETLDALVRLAALAPQLEYAAHAAAAGPELLEEALEAIREAAHAHGQDPYDLQQRLQAAVPVVLTLTQRPHLEALGSIAQLGPALAPVARAAADAFGQLAAVEGPHQLTERLSEAIVQITEPETLDALVRLAALAPQLEYAAHAAAAGPELLEEALEVVRETAHKHGQDPYQLQRRLDTAIPLLLTLTQQSNLQLLLQLSDALEGRRDKIKLGADRALAWFDVWAGALPEIEDPKDFGLRVDKALRLMIQWSDPDSIDRINLFLKSAMQFEPLIVKLAELQDSMDLDALGELVKVAMKPENQKALINIISMAPTLEATLKSLPAQERTLAFLGAANLAIAEAVKANKEVGLWGLTTALRDDDVKRMAGFGVEVAKALGRHLAAPRQLQS